MPDIAERPNLLRTAALLAASIALLSLAFAPISQFYFAWIGLAPWLIFLYDARSQKSAFFFSWIAGTIFFIANMWWMAAISWPGMLALMTFCGLFWGVAAIIIRGAGLLHGGILYGVFATAAIWTAAEWLRGIIFTGLPWLFLGYSQSPILPMCQIADFSGAYGVTFWVVALNGLAALAWINRHRLRAVLPAAEAVAILSAGSLGYGLFRIAQTDESLSPGPTIAVVQANYPQNNRGEKPVDVAERLAFHKGQSLEAIDKNPGKIDLVVWSETMMEALNRTARLEDQQFQDVYDAISRIASENHLALLTGGDYFADWKDETREDGVYRVPGEKRNTAYLFDRGGQMDDSLGHRYDKIHLVPWGEFIPGKETMPWLYNLSVELGPKYYSEYTMAPGEVLTVFHLRGNGADWRFVTPICFEDIDARICSAMFRPDKDSEKRADFLVNLTNDGWFKANENADHLQAASFRSIENRVWSARSVNCGISGFIDSVGRCHDLLPVRTEGTSVGRIMIDRRLSFYTRYGDVFAFGCDFFAVAVAARAYWKRPARAGKMRS